MPSIFVAQSTELRLNLLCEECSLLSLLLLTFCLVWNKVETGIAGWALFYVWVIDQVWGQDGLILVKLFFCMFMRQGQGPWNSHKKEQSHYPAILTEQAWSLQDFFIMSARNFSCVTHCITPSSQDSAHHWLKSHLTQATWSRVHHTSTLLYNHYATRSKI